MLAGTLPVLVFSGAMLAVYVWQQRLALERSLADSARSLAVAVDTELRQTIAALRVLGLLDSLTAGDLKAFHATAKEVIKDQPTWANIVLTGPAGEHLLNLRSPIGAPLPPLNRPDMAVETADSRQAKIFGREVGVITNRPLSVVAVPVVRNDAVKYVLMAASEARGWASLLAAYLGPGQQAALIDHNVKLIARTADGGRFSEGALRAELSQAIKTTRQAVMRGQVPDGRDGYFAYYTSPFSAWTVEVYLPATALSAAVRYSTPFLLAGFAILLAASLVLAIVFARAIANPIGQLTRSVRSVGRGEPPLPVESRILELREAKAALDDAAALLSSRHSQLQRLNQDLEQTNRAKDEFLAMLGHELRNPLGVISNSIAVLRRTDDPEKRAEVRTIVTRQVSHLARLMDDLLDAGRVTAGKIRLERAPVNLGDLVDKHLHEVRVNNKAHVFEAQIEPVWVDGDMVRLEQVLSNLTGNAVKHTPAGGRVLVSARREGDTAVVRVQDTGSGMHADLVPRVFDLFVQGEQSADRKKGGLGLGLTLVRRLVELHGGSVEAYSAGAGQGSTFTVRLSAIAPPEVGARKQADRHPPLARRVLLVEDNDDARAMLYELLRMQGHEVHEARDGLAAVDSARATPFDVAVVDIGLPGIDGYEVARRLRALPGGKDLYLVSLTGYPPRADATPEDFDAYLLKPVQPEKLADIIRSGRQPA